MSGEGKTKSKYKSVNRNKIPKINEISTHNHGESCSCCNHDHDHDHAHHNHEHKNQHSELSSANNGKYTLFILEELDCAHCASKMEDEIRMLEEVTDVSITYATKQMRLTAKNVDEVLPKIKEVCEKIEPNVRIVLPAKKTNYTLFALEELDCAHCASKMEDEIRMLEEVTDVSITYATKQMRLTAKNVDEILPKIKEICEKIEPNVKIVLMENAKSVADTSEIDAKKDKRDIIIGSLMFLGGLLFSDHSPIMIYMMPLLSTILFGVSYLILGKEILTTAVKNVMRGQMLDENFLMSIATVGAVCLGEYSEAVAVMLFFRIGTYCEEKAVNLSRRQITEAVDLRPQVVTVIDGENKVETPAEDVQIGQIIQVLVGDRIPLDGTIVSGESRLDTAAITGEPVPVAIKSGDAVHSGCINLSGVITLRVTSLLEESMVSRILQAVEDAAASKPKIERMLTRFAHVYTPAVVVIAVFTAIVPSFITGEWSYWVHTALTFLVISCPCALVLSVPLAFFSAIGAGSKKGVLFKSGASLEVLNDVKCIATDKTGTVTQGNFVLQKIETATDISEDELLSITASCEADSTHPIAVSIVNAGKSRNLPIQKLTSLEEKAGMGVIAKLNEKTIVCGNEKMLNSENITIPEQEEITGSVVYVAIDGVYQGMLNISDTIKDEAFEAIEKLKKRGIKIAMLTGDNQKTADMTAKKIGIDIVHANLLPVDKLSSLQELRKQHGAVLYIGDGINDAPVLAGADVGGAMGSGADAAIEVADVVFMTSDLTAIDKTIEISKKTHVVVRVNIAFALSVKIIVMILGITGIYSSMWLAIFADVGVSLICVLNSIRTLYRK